MTSTDQVWALDLRPVVAAHLERGSDCTIVTAEASRTQAAEKDVVTVAGRGSRVTGVDHKPDDPSGTTSPQRCSCSGPRRSCSRSTTCAAS